MPNTFAFTLTDTQAAEVARELQQRQKEEPDLTEQQLIQQHASQYWAMRARETAIAVQAETDELLTAFGAANDDVRDSARRALGLTVKAKRG